MDFNKVKSGPVTAEFIGTFTLALAVLASVWGTLPLIPTAVVAGATLGIFVLSIGKTSGSHINPAVTLALFSLKKIDSATTVAYLIAQLGGALVAMIVMSMFLDGELITRISTEVDYSTFFAEFLGTLIFTFGIAAALHQKLDGVNAAVLIGGSLSLGILIASLGSSGVLNPAVAASLGIFNWAYVFGPILGGIVGMNVYALSFGKKGRI